MIKSNADGLLTYFPLCPSTLYYEKQAIWTYLIHPFSYHVLSKSLCLGFFDVLEEFYNFAVIMDPFQTSILAPLYLKNSLLD